MVVVVAANVVAYLMGVTILYSTSACATFPKLPLFNGSIYFSGKLVFSSSGTKSKPTLVAPKKVANQPAEVPIWTGIAIYQYFFTKVLNFWKFVLICPDILGGRLK